MADARDFFVQDSTGAPLTGAAGSFTIIARSYAGAVRPPPTIVELGEGVYRVTPTDDDEAVGTVLHIDLGAGRLQRRRTIVCYQANRSNQAWAFHVENPDSTEWIGAAPTVASYRSSAGSRTPPTPVALAGAYLWLVVPTSADILADVEIRIDGPAGSLQPYFLGVTRPYVPNGSVSWMPGTPSPVPEPSSTTLFGRMAYVRQLKELLPPGSLYNLEPSSALSRTLEAVADEFTRVNARGADLIAESDPRTATETLGEWEKMLGLPDERVLEIPGTTEERRVAITQKYVSRGGQNYSFYETLCAACGYPLVSIEGYVSQVLRAGFRVGARCYGYRYAYAIHLTVGNIVWMNRLTIDEFQRVIRHVTHAHIQVVFTYV